MVRELTHHDCAVVPTISYLVGLPIPQNAESAIIYQAMEDPDIVQHELEKLALNYERVKAALEGKKALTHSY